MSWTNPGWAVPRTCSRCGAYLVTPLIHECPMPPMTVRVKSDGQIVFLPPDPEGGDKE